MSVSRWLIAVSATALSIPLVHLSCVQIDCGEGTIERDGTCVPADSDPGSATCGAGTHLEGQNCVSDSDPTECDPETTTPIVDQETGVITCVGSGVAQGCTGSLACPSPTGTNITLCGQLFDLETTEKLEAGGVGNGTGTRCEGNETSGPCALGMQFYDAIGFVMDPQNAEPLTVGLLYMDDCGRFRAENIPFPDSTFLGVGIDDITGDEVALSGVALAPVQGSTIQGFQAFVMSQETNADWTAQLGLSGETLEEAGAYVTIFRIGEDPVAGVQFTNATGGTYPNDDFYFSDTDPELRTMISDTQTETGANGTSILLNRTGLAQYTGMGGIPDSCSFPTAMGAVIPHVIAAQTREAIIDGSNPPALCTAD
jgi:hypothetical protein